MSIIWTEGFVALKEHNDKFTFESLGFLALLNVLSCICFVLYYYSYTIDTNLQLPPSNYFYLILQIRLSY